VYCADNADEGLERLRSEHFDLVAIDHQMPGKTGLQMLAEIVEMDDHPPVVFVTGNDDTAVAVEALQAGALDFVVKTVGESFFDTLDGRFRLALSRAGLERDKRRAEADLRIANERLELLVREVHHRVSNSLQIVLSFVAMQANQSGKGPVRDALEEIQNRIRAVSKVHQRLYTRDDLTTIDLDAYLSNLVDDLRESLSDLSDTVDLRLELEPVAVSPDIAVSVGVIVNELVSNAAKYAFDAGQSGTITVTLAAQGAKGFSVTVDDDGKGIVDGSAPVGTGLGTRIVAAIARSMGTEVKEVSGARGTAMRFVVTA
jgi:two-component sensor histidine kinase